MDMAAPTSAATPEPSATSNAVEAQSSPWSALLDFIRRIHFYAGPCALAPTVENVFYRDVLTVDAQENIQASCRPGCRRAGLAFFHPLPGRRACAEQSAVALDTARTEELTGTDWGRPLTYYSYAGLANF